jgi:Sec-independent protein secretion pathway component TatC
LLASVSDRGKGYRFGRRLFFRIVWAGIAFSLAFSLVFAKRVEIYAKLIEPADGRLSPFEGGLPVVLGLADMFMSVIWLGMRVGILAGLPVLTIGMMHLFKPWFRPVLYWYTVAFLLITTGCLVAASAFVYYVMAPVGVVWLLKFSNGIAVPVITLNEYISLLSSLILAMAIVFELPPLMFMLTKARIVKYRHWKRIRWVMVGSAFIFSALITPGFDPVNATLVLVPFITLFEFGMFLSWLAHPEDGDYLWARSISYYVTLPYRKLRNFMLTHLGV